MKKGKVLFITNHSYMFWQFRKEVALELQKDYEVVISTPFVGHEDDFADLGFKMIETKVDRRGINPVTDLKLICTYAKILKSEKPDMIITYSIKPNVYAGILCRLRKIPYYVNVQGLGTAFQSKGMAAVASVLYREACKGAETVFFENIGNAELFAKRNIVPESKQTLLPGAGVNLDYYRYEPYPKNDKVRFLYLGRIMKEKGMDELFYAIRKLHEECGDKVVLDLVGFFEDEYKETVNKLVKDGIAVFHGFQKDPRPYYAQADCVVLPSYHEGMSNVLLEAASTGRALITSNIPGCKEAVDVGENGLLCKVKDKESLYKAMKKMVELTPEKRSSIGLNGRKKMEKEFDKEYVVERTINALMKYV